MVKRISSKAWVERDADGGLTLVSIQRKSSRGATILARNVALPREFTLRFNLEGSIRLRCRIVRTERYTAIVEFIKS